MKNLVLKYSIFALSPFLFSVSAFADMMCLQLFSLPLIEASMPYTISYEILEGRQFSWESRLNVLELGTSRIPRQELSATDMEYLIHAARDFLKDPTINDSDVREALFAAQKKYGAQIDAVNASLGKKISITVREMRKRRLKFALAIEAGDDLAASTVYRSLWESYYVAKSQLVDYMMGDATARDARLLSKAKWILRGLTEEPTLKDLRKQVDKMYKNGASPTVEMVLTIYDQIYARTNDEFRYASFYISETRKNAVASQKQSVVDNIDYILRRLSPDKKSERFGIEMLSQQFLDQPEVTRFLQASRPQQLIYWLKYSSERERSNRVWLSVKSVVQEVGIRFTSLIPTVFIRDAVRAVIMLDYNSYVINVHIDALEAVTMAKDDVRLDVFLKSLSGNLNRTNQFLETFARLSSDMTVWSQLKKQVEALAKDEENFAILLNQMNEAQKKTATHGWVTQINETSVFETSVGLLVTASPVIVTIASNWAVVSYWTQTTVAAAEAFVVSVPQMVQPLLRSIGL